LWAVQSNLFFAALIESKAMTNIALRVEGLSKQYHIGAKRTRYKTLRETIVEVLQSPLHLVAKLGQREVSGTAQLTETIWALKDVAFEIERGEVVGIIGRNGAGKSSLLKILARVTEPTRGFAEIHGRVGSLLEVGTGFHSELTGRENIYLNGAILGMKRVEIQRKFDEIVAFAEVEKFIDTPVKHYSSGMYLRLAFAVAAHMEPEILIVDEVLAVGDERFQKRCLSKMENVAQHGRTVLFVSHDMPAIVRLCKRAILLDGGRLQRDGSSHSVVSAYLNSGLGTTAAKEWPDPAKAPGGHVARLRAVRVRNEDGQISDCMDIRRPVQVEMEYEVITEGYVLLPYYEFFNEEGVYVFATAELNPAWRGRPRPAGRYMSTVWIPGNFLSEGTLFVGTGLDTMYPTITQFRQRDVVAFQVVDSLDGDSARGDTVGRWGGAVRPLLTWSTQFTPSEGKAAPMDTAKYKV
jgi:lipopolysaccharide transport system ATP-binding protein